VYKRDTSTLGFPSSLEILQSLFDPFGHGLLSLTDPDSRIKVFLIGFILAIWIADLGGKVRFLVDHVIPYPRTIGKLQVGIEIDFDDTVRDGFAVFLFGTSTATVEHQEPIISLIKNGLQRFLVFGFEVFPGVGLMIAEEFRMETDVTRFVDTVDISESCSDGKVWANSSKGTVYIPDILWLSVQ
jgi:hypothetical protein